MNRWGIAVAGVLLQVALGAVYAWSPDSVMRNSQIHGKYPIWSAQFNSKRGKLTSTR